MLFHKIYLCIDAYTLAITKRPTEKKDKQSTFSTLTLASNSHLLTLLFCYVLLLFTFVFVYLRKMDGSEEKLKWLLIDYQRMLVIKKNRIERFDCESVEMVLILQSNVLMLYCKFKMYSLAKEIEQIAMLCRTKKKYKFIV